MDLSMGNKNVVLGLLVIVLFLTMSVHIERTASQHAFQNKAAAAVVDTKNTPDLLDDQITDIRKGPAYRTGGIYFTNYYAASYTPVPNNFFFTAYNMRLYAWMFALLGIAVGFIVGVQRQASLALRQLGVLAGGPRRDPVSHPRRVLLLGSLDEPELLRRLGVAGRLSHEVPRRHRSWAWRCSWR
ncbi:MAG: hypothetical protein M0C28_23945 [Candidatus Moduliflexus flocculans]|nr:hypothetical protein [Candidatus Moduliflexus flocculans]